MPEESPTTVDPKQQANEVLAAVDAMLLEALKSREFQSGDPRIEIGRGNQGFVLSTTRADD